MRWPWNTETESPEAFRTRMREFQQFTEELHQKPWEEVKGTSWAVSYCFYWAAEAAKQNDKEAAYSWIERLLQSEPTSGSSYFYAAAVHQELGEESEALAKLGIALVLDPSYYPAHCQMTKILLKSGEREAAEAILELGWKQKKKCERIFRMKHGEKERKQFFAILNS